MYANNAMKKKKNGKKGLPKEKERDNNQSLSSVSARKKKLKRKNVRTLIWVHMKDGWNVATTQESHPPSHLQVSA